MRKIGGALLFSTVLFLAGCGGTEGPTRYAVSGKVTFNGTPVPAGQIIFEPAGASATAGAAGHAEIANGQFDTKLNGGEGSLGGPTLVRIDGYEPGTAGTNGKTLFTGYTTQVDLPKEAKTIDFDVPATAAAPPSDPSVPAP